MVFVYCVFHLDQALRRYLVKMTDPGMGKEKFSRFKGFILREVHELVCGRKGEPPIPGEEFNTRAELVSTLLWGFSLEGEASRWDEYVRVKERWAPFERWRICNELFGDREKLPMLVVSNNVLESFFRVLKHVLLDGSSTTMTGLLRAWTGHQSRIVSNLLESNINPSVILRTQGWVASREQEEEEDTEWGFGDFEREDEGGEEEEDEEEEEESPEELYARLERDTARNLVKNQMAFKGLLAEVVSCAQVLKDR